MPSGIKVMASFHMHGTNGLCIHLAARPKWTEPRAIEQLRPEMLPMPAWSMKSAPIGVLRATIAAKGRFRIGALLKRIRAEPREQAVPVLLVVEEQSVGPRSSSQSVVVQMRSRSAPLGFGQRHGPFTEVVEAAKVHVQNQVAAKVVAEMLAACVNAAQFAPVKGRRVRELPGG